MEAGTLVEWLVKPGDRVKRGDIVAVVETQKGAIEIEIFEAGKIEQLLVGVDTKVPIGTPLARIQTEFEGPPGAVAAAPPPGRRPFRSRRRLWCGRPLPRHRHRPSRQAPRRTRGYRQPRGGSPRPTGSTPRR